MFISANGLAAPEEADSQNDSGLSLKEVFYRVLDKNLKAGIAQKTLQAVHWHEVPIDSSLGINADQPILEPEDALPPPTRLAGFSCALGKTVLRDDLARLTTLPADSNNSESRRIHQPKWLASRKLDGVRLIVVVDIFTPIPSEADLGGARVLNIWTMSRSGKEYHTLDVLKEGLSNALKEWPRLAEILEREPHHPASRDHVQGYIQRLVLDGELCHLNESGDPERPTEDFTQIVSMVRRKDYTIQRPALFLLDVLPWSVFVDGMNKDGYGSAKRYKVFADRSTDCEALARRVAELGGKVPVVRRLEQTQVHTIKEVEDMIGVAAERGWEGIVLRRSDVPYVGKRKYVVASTQEALLMRPTALVSSSTKNGRTGSTPSRL